MARLKFAFIIFLPIIALFGCSSTNALKTSTETPIVQTTVVSGNPYPLQQTTAVSSNSENPYPMNQPTENSPYPNPDSSNQNLAITMNPENYVTELVIPTPSGGKAVITGQLLKGDKPFITTLYLSAAELNTDPSQPPIVHFVAQSDPMAVQEVSTGKFMFSGITPGKYAIVAWSPSDSFFLTNNGGNTLIFDVIPEEVKDLGVITVQ